MKRLVTILLTILVSFSLYAEELTFYGLKFGDTVNEKNIKKTMRGKGKYEGKDELIVNERHFDTYCFSGSEYGGEKYEYVYFLVNRKGELTMVRFTRARAKDITVQNFYKEYVRLRDAFFDNETFRTDRSNIEEGVTDKKYFGYVIGSVLDIASFSAKIDGGEDDEIVLVIGSTFRIPLYPDLQDTFFGLTLGKKTGELGIEAAVGDRGRFQKKESLGAMGKVVTYLDVQFGGLEWHFADFTLAPDGRFYGFNLYGSYDCTVEKEVAQARERYDTMKDALAAKYGEGKPGEENGVNESLVWNGDNDMLLVLSRRCEPSKGGAYRWFVEVYYVKGSIHTELYGNQKNEF